MPTPTCCAAARVSLRTSPRHGGCETSASSLSTAMWAGCGCRRPRRPQSMSRYSVNTRWLNAAWNIRSGTSLPPGLRPRRDFWASACQVSPRRRNLRREIVIRLFEIWPWSPGLFGWFISASPGAFSPAAFTRESHSAVSAGEPRQHCRRRHGWRQSLRPWRRSW